jgi:tRNA A-37 threonylcarbamoyl transferase component Bud32
MAERPSPQDNADEYGQTVFNRGAPPRGGTGPGMYDDTVVRGARPSSVGPGSSLPGGSSTGAGRRGDASWLTGTTAFGGDGGDDAPTVLCELGRGGMGVVQLVRVPRLNRYEAVKRISADLALDDESIARFLNEARAAAQLKHPCIVGVYDITEDGAGPMIRMAYVEGPYPPAPGRPWPAGAPKPPLDLDGYVKRKGPLPVDEAVRMVRTVCAGLAEAHAAGIVHRDVKPANILVTENLEPRLADFGLARHDAQAAAAARSDLTRPGTQMLTPGYGAPEQERDAAAVDGRADLYALGATLFYAATGQPPRLFRESETPEPIRAVVIKAMATDPARRYQTAQEMGEALGATLAADAKPAAPAAAAGSGGGGTLAPGICFACGHQHGGDADRLKFCAACGEPLQVPCLSCQSSNPIWNRFCGQCRHDTIAAVDRLKAQCADARSRLAEDLAKFDLDGAKAVPLAVGQTIDPRLAADREWARSQLAGPIHQIESAARQALADAATRARALEEQQDYANAVRVLGELPPALRQRLADPSIAAAGGTAVSTLSARLQAKQRRLDVLVATIPQSMTGGRWEDVKQQVAELQSLRQHHPQIPAAVAFVRDAEARAAQRQAAEAERKRAAEQAEQAAVAERRLAEAKRQADEEARQAAERKRREAEIAEQRQAARMAVVRPAFDVTRVDFGTVVPDGTGRQRFELVNPNDLPIAGTLSVDQPWCRVTPRHFTLNPRGKLAVTVAARALRVPNGRHVQATVIAKLPANGNEARLPVYLHAHLRPRLWARFRLAAFVASIPIAMLAALAAAVYCDRQNAWDPVTVDGGLTLLAAGILGGAAYGWRRCRWSALRLPWALVTAAVGLAATAEAFAAAYAVTPDAWHGWPAPEAVVRLTGGLLHRQLPATGLDHRVGVPLIVFAIVLWTALVVVRARLLRYRYRALLYLLGALCLGGLIVWPTLDPTPGRVMQNLSSRPAASRPPRRPNGTHYSPGVGRNDVVPTPAAAAA